MSSSKPRHLKSLNQLLILIILLSLVYLYLFLAPSASTSTSNQPAAIPLGASAISQPGEIQGSSPNQANHNPSASNYSPQQAVPLKPSELNNLSL